MLNLDGIQKTKQSKKTSAPVVKVRHVCAVDSIAVVSKKQAKPKETFYTGFFVPPRQELPRKQKVDFLAVLSGRLKIFGEELSKEARDLIFAIKNFNWLQKPTPAYFFGIMLVVAFSAGAWSALSTQTSEAESPPQVQAGSIPLETSGSMGPISNVSNDVLFNMTIGQLENYLNSVAEENRQVKAAEQMALRKQKLRAYLKAKNTPFAEVSDTIAEQKHWKLILAISFAESTFGKNCVDNNCSNIGVKPGHPYWHKYATLADWVKDFNRLLERKYSDWTLEEMNGVYVQPKNPNWLAATRQILEELQEQGIE